MELRDYQKEVVQLALTNQNKTALYVLPTGAGKTVIFTAIIKKLLEENKKILVLAHRRILIEQIHRYNEGNHNLQVATKQGYVNKLDFAPDYIIIDEAHNVDYEKGQYKAILEAHNNAVVVGFTATPIRMNNGLIYGKDKFFKSVDYFKKPEDLINAGYLVPYKVIVPSEFKDKESLKNNFTLEEASLIMQKNYLLDLVVDSYKKFARKKTLVFATDIKHSELLLEYFVDQGIFAKIIHSKQRKDEIDYTLKQFKESKIDCLINVDMLTEGFDEPAVDTVILARPTKSIALHRQIIGRGLRLWQNKKDCLVVDLVSNFYRNGDINENLNDKKIKQNEPYYVCDKCFMVSFVQKKECLFCGYIPITESLTRIREDKDITRLTADQFKELDFLMLQKNKWFILETQGNMRSSTDCDKLTIVIKAKKDGVTQDFNFYFTSKNPYFFKNFCKKFGHEYDDFLNFMQNYLKLQMVFKFINIGDSNGFNKIIDVE
jgi:superfamily II DNA or RNA helicase